MRFRAVKYQTKSILLGCKPGPTDLSSGRPALCGGLPRLPSALTCQMQLCRLRIQSIRTSVSSEPDKLQGSYQKQNEILLKIMIFLWCLKLP